VEGVLGWKHCTKKTDGKKGWNNAPTAKDTKRRREVGGVIFMRKIGENGGGARRGMTGKCG